jgi:hypothetical protein
MLFFEVMEHSVMEGFTWLLAFVAIGHLRLQVMVSIFLNCINNSC